MAVVLLLAAYLISVVPAQKGRISGGKQLTSLRNSYCWAPTWSPDGRELAFVVAPRLEAAHPGLSMAEFVKALVPGNVYGPPAGAQVCTMSLADKKVATLGSGWAPLWYPIKGALLYLEQASERRYPSGHLRGQFAWAKGKARGGEVRLPGPDVYIECCLSPDGRLLAFVAFHEPYETVVGMADLESGKSQQLAQGRIGLTRLAGWSEAGDFLFYLSEGVLYRWRRDSKKVSRVAAGVGLANPGAVAPKGDRLVLAGRLKRGKAQWEWELPVVNSDSGKQQVIARLQNGRVQEALWQPHGDWLAYAGEDDKGWRLELVSSDGKKHKTLVHSRSPLHGLAWSPDGRRIAYVVGGPIYLGEPPGPFRPDGQLWWVKTPAPRQPSAPSPQR